MVWILTEMKLFWFIFEILSVTLRRHMWLIRVILQGRQLHPELSVVQPGHRLSRCFRRKTLQWVLQIWNQIRQKQPFLLSSTSTTAMDIVTRNLLCFCVCIQTTQTALTFTSWGWKKKISSAATPPRCASTRHGYVTAQMIAGTTPTRPTARVSGESNTRDSPHSARALRGRSGTLASIKSDLNWILCLHHFHAWL